MKPIISLLDYFISPVNAYSIKHFLFEKGKKENLSIFVACNLKKDAQF